MPSSLAKLLEESKCEYRRLGKSGLKVSVPIIGAMGMGNKDWMDWVLDEEHVRDHLVHRLFRLCLQASLGSEETALLTASRPCPS